MRIVFAGTPEFAAAHLQALLENRVTESGEAEKRTEKSEVEKSDTYEIVAVYTQPDRKAGRGKKLVPPPVKVLAEKHQIPVHQPLTLKTEEEQATLAEYQADIMVVVAYGMLLPKTILDMPKYGCINVHASLLPRWRGAAPIERAIMAGDKETGITIMQMDEGLDTGNMLLKASCPIEPNETGDSLRDKLIELGKPLLTQVVENIADNSLKPLVQDDKLATYAKKLHKSEMTIDWRWPAIDIERQIRAFTSALNCFAFLDEIPNQKSDKKPNENRIRISRGWAIEASNSTQTCGHIQLLDGFPSLGFPDVDFPSLGIEGPCLHISCGEGALIVDTVQIPGGKAMSIKALLNGKPSLFQTGMQFSLPESDPTT